MDEQKNVSESVAPVLGKPQTVPAPPGQRVLTSEEMKEGAGINGGPNDKCRIRGQVVCVLTNEKTGKKRTFVSHNIITNDGDHYYAQLAAAEATLFTVAGMRLGTNAGAATAPIKADVKFEDTTTSVFLAGSGKAIDATYPKTDDGDSDNPGAGPDIVTWRVSYTTGEANSANIASLDVSNNIVTPTLAVSVANFAAKFEKTSSDTLKVFVNHTFNGV